MATTKQQQVEEFKKKKEAYDNASTAEEKKAVINGVDEATTNKMNSTFTASNEQGTAQNKANEGMNRVESLTSKDSIISSDVKAKLNTSFTVPPAVTEADTYIKSQLQKIQSGKTSYSDQVKGMMDQIMNREKFSYDVDSDPLFQQALASSMNSGKQAMQDTIGQASALTGGYGSTYATTAGNQAYNSFIEDAYDNLPQYYQMAMEAYQMEGDEMYRQLGMLNEADATEYNRNVTAYDATYQHRNQMYNEAYQQFRDSKTDAYNMANLQLNEHGQLVSDAVNYYNVTSDYANTMYNREYQKWSDEVNQAMKYAEMLNTDYWNQTNFDEGVRQYEKSFDEGVRQYNDSRYWDNYWNQADEDYRRDALEQDNYWNQKDLDYKNSALDEDKRQFNTSMGDTNNDGVVSDEEYAKYVERYGSKSDDTKTGYVERVDENGKKVQLKLPSETQNAKALEAWNKDMEANDGNLTEFNKYLDSLNGVDTETIEDYVSQHGFGSFEDRTFTKTTDSVHGFLGIQNYTGAAVDQGDIVEDEYGNKYDLEDLAKLGLSEDFLKKLTGLKKGESYKYAKTSSGAGGKF